MPSLGVVADGVVSLHPGRQILGGKGRGGSWNTCLIHWGMGRFCFIFLASFLLMRKVFKADILASGHFLSERIVDSDLGLLEVMDGNHRFNSKKI